MPPPLVRLRKLLAAVLAAAALIWLMTGLFLLRSPWGYSSPCCCSSGSGIALPPHRLLPEGCCSGGGVPVLPAAGACSGCWAYLGCQPGQPHCSRQLPQLWNSVLGHLLPQLESLFSSHLPLAAWGDYHLGTHPFRMDFPDLPDEWAAPSPLAQPLARAAAGQRLYCTAQFLCRCRLSPALRPARQRISTEKIAVLKNSFALPDGCCCGCSQPG